MGTETEPAKTLLPYLQRADELQKHEPLVAYYCRLYAMEKGLKIPPKERTKTTNSLLVSLMNQLEKDKKSLKLGNEDYLYVEGFALNVFSKADKQDRAGRADLNTAKTFYAASIFFEILYQFGELQPDIEQKQKYAVWKAADIRKALKEGRKPVPGPPGGEQDSSISYDTSTNIYDLGPTEDAPPSHPGGTDTIPPPPYKAAYQPPPPQHQPTSPPSHHNLDYPPDEFHQPPPPQHQPTSPPSHHNLDYPPDEFHQPPPPQQPDNSSYPQTFHQPQPPQQPDNSSYPQTYHQPQPPQQPDNSSYPQTYHQEHPPPQNYPSHEEVSPYHQQHISNYQSYPSFNHGDPPSVPSNYSSYYQGSDASYSHPSVPSATEYPPTVQYNSSSDDGYRAAKPAAPPAAPKYTYDSNYQPEPEKITEAHKAARFAVGALAFDDVPVAVEFLSRSLELLTNPSASANSSSHA